MIDPLWESDGDGDVSEIDLRQVKVAEPMTAPEGP
jgi:hypothetical protein